MSLRQRLKRYEKLREQAEEVFEQTGQQLSQLNQQIDRMTEACDMLQNWLQSADEATGSAADQARVFKQRQQMRAHVQQTLQQQRHQLAQLQQQQLQLRQQWLEARARVRALEKLVERLRVRLSEQAMRIEQREQDERSAWQVAMRSGQVDSFRF